MRLPSLTIILAAFAAVVLWSAQAASYDSYRSGGPNDNCFQCHNGFAGKGPLHDLHVGNQNMTNNCTLCHTSTGDTPKTDSSGSDPAHGCNGCHTGPGLRLHHAAAGAPTDAFGLSCASCHGGDPTPAQENSLPPYYSRTDVNVSSPCESSTASGGEDFNNDGEGLDNDGDLAYEANDADCAPMSAFQSTWGMIKALY